MKKNVLLLFCLLLSSCYINKFNDYNVSDLPITTPKLDSKMWTPITKTPIHINNDLSYISYVGKKNIIYIYLNQKNQLIYLEYNPQQNITRQQNISSVVSPTSSIVKLTYTEFGSQRIIGLVELESDVYRFRSYIIHNNFNTSLQYEFDIPGFQNYPYFLNFHTTKKGNLTYINTEGIQTFYLSPSTTPPAFELSTTPAITLRETDPYRPLSRAGNSVVLYSGTTFFNTSDFVDVKQGATTYSEFTDLIFSLTEDHDIWATFTDTLGMHIVKVTVDDAGNITEESIKTGILGSKGIIAKGFDSDYFLASQNTENKIEISTTKDQFQTLESLGVADSDSTPKDVNLLSLNGVPYFSYADNGKLIILKYSKTADDPIDPGVIPSAKITMESTTVTAGTEFSVSAASSTGNNLTYFWYTTPSTGVNIEDPVLSTTRITLPPSSTKITITLEINDGSRSSTATQEVTVL